MKSLQKIKKDLKTKNHTNRFLIFYATAGNGHLRAAQAVQKQIEKSLPSAQVQMVDAFRYISPLLEKAVSGSYSKMIKISPSAYGYLYRQMENERLLQINKFFNRFASKKIFSLINSFKPDVILSTYPFPLGVLSNLKQKCMINFPITATITDFEIHPYWIYDHVSYCVATEETKFSFENHGYNNFDVHVTGIPIDPVFSEIEEKNVLRKKLSLNVKRPAVLVISGGLGVGPIENIVRGLMRYNADYQVLVVCGRNQALKYKLQKIGMNVESERLRIFGFVDNIHELMGAADLITGKAGGLTCSEAMAIGRPLFIIKPVPGQEEHNARFLVKQGAAVSINNVERLLSEIYYHMKNRSVLENMSRAAKAIGKPNSAEEVLKVILKLIEENCAKLSRDFKYGCL
ncbi:glycosyltransferase [Peptococcaceae bacterium]|nr:glycosyltransferase [Peptococcaceae bacterium]